MADDGRLVGSLRGGGDGARGLCSEAAETKVSSEERVPLVAVRGRVDSGRAISGCLVTVALSWMADFGRSGLDSVVGGALAFVVDPRGFGGVGGFSFALEDTLLGSGERISGWERRTI